MEFQQVKEGEWRAYSNPFTFWIFANDDHSCDVICHYGDSTHRENGNENNFPILEKAIEWCHEFALKQTLKQLQEIAPEGGRTEVIDYEYKFVCDGAIPDMGWRCYLPIGHKGECYTRTKNTHFEREN